LGFTKTELIIKKSTPEDKVIALAGNPNVGKSTVFNNLTGLNQHTGNWPGKTVSNAQGICSFCGTNYVMVDLPGTYSLMAHSAEEEVARDFICFGNHDAVIVVCDATCLERNINLVLQIIEITTNVIVCVNLLDEAKKKNIVIDLDALAQKLGVSVVDTVARRKKDLQKLMLEVENILSEPYIKKPIVKYLEPIEKAIDIIEPLINQKVNKQINTRWLCLKLLDYDETLINSLDKFLGFDLLSDEEINNKLKEARNHLVENGIDVKSLRDIIVSCIVKRAEDICKDTVKYNKETYITRDRKIDKILTSKLTGIPIMICLFALVFWITISGANYPSRLLSEWFFWMEGKLTAALQYIDAPAWFIGILVDGVYRVLAWVISVMLPPMAIFFPLFTLLEDLGYLPRIAFNLDKYFKKCCACGKQALTMCMGFGCNAVGVIGCRIIDSPRERLIAIITNNFVPCNGRFPTLIAVLSMFFVGTVSGAFKSVFSAILLTVVIIFGILMTFAVSKILSKTILKGVPSSFTLELPPFRKPQIGKVIVRSIFDRTLFVLGRAVCTAAPAGIIIWLMANITINDITLLAHCSDFLDPFAQLLGLDGVILLAFILGLPANEIVVPIIIMAYISSGKITELETLSDLKNLLVANGWTWVTAISMMLFSLLHWPCATTCLTIKKETQSIKWTAVSFIVPTVFGILVCIIFTSIARLFV